MVNELNVLQRLRELGGSRTLGEIRSAIASKNREAFKAKHASRFSYEIWDRVSPINGCPATAVLSRSDCANADAIYLIREDGIVKFLQSHAPNGGTISATAVSEVAKSHVAAIIDDLVDTDIINEVLMDLL